jgi:superfamily I DNA/RNA helicase
MNLTFVGASAGSGKTTRLTREVIDALDAGVPLDGLVAVTYTTKAAAELSERIRRSLVEQGKPEEATRLPLALLGTVHATCLRLLSEFAIEAGFSPRIEPLGNEDQLLQALEPALSAALRARLDRLARRLGIGLDNKDGQVDWVTRVKSVMELTRINRIDPAGLPAMGRRAADSLLELLPPPLASGSALDAALDQAVECAITRLRALAARR